MAGKHDPLTADEVDAVRLLPGAQADLDRWCREGRAPSRIRVLDLGCGRGATVLSLLRQGFDAYGVEVDKGPVDKGRAVFAAEGFSADERLRVFDASRPGGWPFETDWFDLVISNQVVEHVADLDAVVREIARVTTPGGRGHHCFPAKWLRVEPHVFVPYVHWLPKNRLRHWWLRRRQRDLPQWRGHERLTPEQRIDTFYEYLNRKTYYRPLSRIRAAFEQAGLKVQFGDVAAPSVRRSLRGRLRDWRERQFRSVRLGTRKG